MQLEKTRTGKHIEKKNQKNSEWRQVPVRLQKPMGFRFSNVNILMRRRASTGKHFEKKQNAVLRNLG